MRRVIVLSLLTAILMSGCSAFDYKDQLTVRSDQYAQYAAVKQRELELKAEMARQPIVDVQGQISSIKVWMPGGLTDGVDMEQPKLHEPYWAEVTRDLISAGASVGKWYIGAGAFTDLAGTVFEHAGHRVTDSYNTSDSYNRAWEQSIQDAYKDQRDYDLSDIGNDSSENWTDDNSDNRIDNSDNRSDYGKQTADPGEDDTEL